MSFTIVCDEKSPELTRLLEWLINVAREFTNMTQYVIRTQHGKPMGRWASIMTEAGPVSDGAIMGYLTSLMQPPQFTPAPENIRGPISDEREEDSSGDRRKNLMNSSPTLNYEEKKKEAERPKEITSKLPKPINSVAPSGKGGFQAEKAIGISGTDRGKQARQLQSEIGSIDSFMNPADMIASYGSRAMSGKK